MVLGHCASDTPSAPQCSSCCAVSMHIQHGMALQAGRRTGMISLPWPVRTFRLPCRSASLPLKTRALSALGMLGSCRLLPGCCAGTPRRADAGRLSFAVATAPASALRCCTALVLSSCCTPAPNTDAVQAHCARAQASQTVGYRVWNVSACSLDDLDLTLRRAGQMGCQGPRSRQCIVTATCPLALGCAHAYQQVQVDVSR